MLLTLPQKRPSMSVCFAAWWLGVVHSFGGGGEGAYSHRWRGRCSGRGKGRDKLVGVSLPSCPLARENVRSWRVMKWTGRAMRCFGSSSLSFQQPAARGFPAAPAWNAKLTFLSGGGVTALSQ